MGKEASASSSSSLVDLPSRKQKQTRAGFFILLIPVVIFPLESKSSSRVGNYVSKGVYIPNTQLNVKFAGGELICPIITLVDLPA